MKIMTKKIHTRIVTKAIRVERFSFKAIVLNGFDKDIEMFLIK